MYIRLFLVLLALSAQKLILIFCLGRLRHMTWPLLFTWDLSSTPVNRSTWYLWIQVLLCSMRHWTEIKSALSLTPPGTRLRTHMCHAGTVPGESKLCVQRCAVSACLTCDVRSWDPGRGWWLHSQEWNKRLSWHQVCKCLASCTGHSI